MCFLLVGDGLLRVFLGFLHVVGRLVDVVLNPVDHFALQEAPHMTHRDLAQGAYLRSPEFGLPGLPPPWRGTGTCRGGL